MAAGLRLAITADLHWGIHCKGDEATQRLIAFLRSHSPDVLIVAGDIGSGENFGACLTLFDDLSCRKALVPGNHDIWVEAEDPRGDSLQVYQEHLPGLSCQHGFLYLDQGPLLLPEANLALVGSINWYDYSWSLDQLRQEIPDWQDRLKEKIFSRGRHNDARFVRWSLDDVRFTAEVVQALERQLNETLRQAERAIVVTHHPAFYGLSFPRPGPATDIDALLWDAFAGNRTLEAVLGRYAERIPFVFCGHTHRARQNRLGGIRGYNVGGDYDFKRLLLVDWPRGKVKPYTFADPGL